MNHREYVAQREARDPEFRAAREALRSEYDFRREIIAARLRAKLTQQQLAEKMGTKQSVVARLESGTHVPTLDTLQRLAGALGVQFHINASEGVTVRPQRRVRTSDRSKRAHRKVESVA